MFAGDFSDRPPPLLTVALAWEAQTLSSNLSCKRQWIVVVCRRAKGVVLLNVELTPDAAHWVEAEIAAGTFPTAEDPVRYAINQAKTIALRAKLDAAITEAGDNIADDVRYYVRQHL